MPPRKRTEVTDVHRQQIAMHLTDGLGVRAIAASVGLSKSTVANEARKMKGLDAVEPPESDPGDEPQPALVVVPDDAPDYEPLRESRRLLYMAEQALARGARDLYQKLAKQSQDAYALHVKVTPPEPIPTDEQPDMIEAANQARSKLFSQLARSVARAQEPEQDP